MFFIKNFILALIISSVIISPLAAEEKLAKGEDAPRGIGEIRVIKANEIDVKEWTTENYLINTGDVLDISVWQVEELEKTAVVRPDGKISFPLIGDLPVAGFTINEISKDITAKLKTYIKNPQVTVMVASYGGKKIIVLGEVGNKGIIRFTEPTKIIEILALSGGYTEAAALKSVLVIRGNLKGPTDIIVVNVLDIYKGKLRENIYIEQGDLVYVPRSFVGNVAYFIRQIGPLLGAATEYYSIKKTYYDIKSKGYKSSD